MPDPIFPLGHDDGINIARALDGIAAENIKHTALLAAIANTTVSSALLADWTEVQAAIQDGLGPAVLPIGTKIYQTLTDSHGAGDPVTYNAPWNSSHFGQGALADGEIINVMYLQMHNCLPFATEFSPKQAFLYAIDGLPAGTYNITLSADTYGRTAGTYQFTLTSDLPAGGQLCGFFDAGAAASVKAYASPTTKVATETCAVTSGSAGTNLGTFSAAGAQVVPASGTPATHSTVNIGGTDYTYYGLNSQQRVSYGDNRWLHSPQRSWLNSTDATWTWAPATVFDRPPSYDGYPGFLYMLPAAFVAAMKPIAQKTALNYTSDGGSAASPEFDTTYDRVFLPSWGQHYLQQSQSFGSSQADAEGEAWEYWERVAGTTSPLPASTSDPSTYHPEYVQSDIAANTARGVWMRSCYRSSAGTVAIVYSSGDCNGGSACNGYFAAPACAIG